MELAVGQVLEGTVTGITKFGAFVSLEGGKSGLVHISEVANTFVSEIKDFIQEGQTVKVKVLALGDDGKISLSIKKAQPAPPKKQRENGSDRDGRNQGRNRDGKSRENRPYKQSYDRQPQDFTKNPPPVYDPQEKSGDADFEDMLSKFKATSEERFTDLKKVIDNKRRSPSRRK